MKKVTVKASQSYEVIIEKGILSRAGELIAESFKPCGIMLITDSNVSPLYADKAKRSLEQNGFKVSTFVFPAGEESKNSDTLVKIWSALASVPLTRSDMIVALGGGVVGDVSGFAAATFLRGIKYIQIPTTLLAMVDSSVGGKTAIDLPEGKNLCGAFCQPSLVICDTDTLNTLPKREFSCGMAEVIKYGMIDRPIIFDLIKNGDIDDTVFECVSAKRDKVEEDEFDTGVRQLLNLGHTVGHAIERLANFSLSHGEAVAAGMAIITRYAVKEGLCPKEAENKLIEALNSFDLPINTEREPAELAKAALNDKKRRGNSITLVVPMGIGKSELIKKHPDELEEIIRLGY